MSENNKKKNWKPKSRNSSFELGTKVKVYSESSSENYNVWNIYMPDDVSHDDVSLKIKLNALESFFASYYVEKHLIDIEKNSRFYVDIGDVLADSNLKISWPSFKSDLDNSPELTLGLLGLACDNVIVKSKIRDNSEMFGESDNGPFKKIYPRVVGMKTFLRFQDLKTYNYGKFISIMGIVVRATEVKPYCIQMAFMCSKCQTVQFCSQSKGCFTPPSRCIGKKCFATTFKPLLKSPLTKTVPWKVARLQELSINQDEGGRVPRIVECELMCDLTDSCTPGDIVLISGILTVGDLEARKMMSSNEASAYVLSVKVNSVTCLKGKDAKNESISDNLHFNTEDMNVIKNIHSSKNLFQKVVASLSPNIYGHDLVKAGIVLVLFGGNDSSAEDGSQKKFSTRENSHILIVGDPGLGKSQMLLASADVSPRGVYVCGNSTTTSGLTVTVTKESGGDNCLEAGALVLADQGHCCIDEFDKMESQQSALLEAMEQQTISMAKSGVVCTLPARTSIIAAANPTGGHYNKAKTVSENLKIKGSLLSRFDIVFILQDKPNKAFDSKMSDQVMALHSGKLQKVFPNQNDTFNTSNQQDEKHLIPRKALQKYISYARKFSQPKLTREVCTILQDFYMEMRKMHKLSSGTPITTRQLESLVRLTKSRARVELRSHCTKTDAEQVIEIMKHSMVDTFSDEYGNIDFDRSIHGSGMSKRSEAKKFLNILTKTANIKGDDCFTVSEMKTLLQKAKISLDSFSYLLESLNDQGYLLKKGYQLYKIQTM